MAKDLKGYSIEKNEKGGFSVYKNGELCDNSKGAMREMAEIIGLEVDAKWTTQQFGSKLLKAIGEGAKSESPVKKEAMIENTVTPAARKEPTPKKEAKPTKTVSSEEDALKARIAELEKELAKQKASAKEEKPAKEELKSKSTGIKSVEGDIFAEQMIFVKGGSVEQHTSGVKLMRSPWHEYPDGDHRRKPIYHSAEYASFSHIRIASLNDFWVSKKLVTQTQWQSITNTNPSLKKGDAYPIHNVGRASIIHFIKNLPHPIGKKYDLITEAQWQYIFSNNKELITNSYVEDWVNCEMCRDAYQDDLGTSSVIDPVTAPNGNDPVMMTLAGERAKYAANHAGFRLVLRDMTEQEMADETFDCVNKNFKMHYEASEGAIRGLFRVSPTKAVVFGKGNLQYNAKNNQFKFAETQWEFIGDGNAHIAPNYDGWIDLFGYGTSGYSGVFPYEISKDYSIYPYIDIADTEYDWGVHNPIINAGNKKGQWRTLSHKEWEYLMFLRPQADVLNGKAVVNGIRGNILLPDDFYTLGVKCSFKANAERDRDNTISLAEWNIMEQAGAIFLPQTGTRIGNTYYACNSDEKYRRFLYWSSSILGNGYKYQANVAFGGDITCGWDKTEKAAFVALDKTSYERPGIVLWDGLPVRLVKDVL